MTCVGSYLATRLAQIGLRHHFVVPGDYNLVLLDKLQAHPQLQEVNATNELNCSFSAEGYARAHGIAACVVTFSVGALSAFNGTGGAYAENLPVILVSGSPNTNDAGEFHLLHHTIGTHNFDYQFEMAQRITCAAVQIKRASDAPKLIDYALRQAILNKKPVYIEIPTNLSTAACPAPGSIHSVTSPVPSDSENLAAAIEASAEFLKSKGKPILLAGPKLRMAEAEGAFLELAEALGCAVCVMPNGKTLFPEHHKQYAGVYWGTVSTLGAEAIMDWSDVAICAGCVFSDYTTTGWTSLQSGMHRLEADPESIQFPNHSFSRVKMADFLSGLAKAVNRNDTTLVEYNRLKPSPTSYSLPEPKTALTRANLKAQVEKLLTPKTTVFAETGDAWFNTMQMSFPQGAKYEIEMQWGHIGWSVPSSFGYAVGAPDRQVITMVGDGSFQMTVQEVSQMARFKLPIILFLLNNRGYTIEVEIHDGPYNNIKNWDYAALVETFNSNDAHAKGFRATTSGELSNAIKQALAHKDGPTLIECCINRDDCTNELITWGHFVAMANGRPPAKKE